MYQDRLALFPAGSVTLHGRIGNAVRLTVENRLKKVDYAKLVRSFRDHEDRDGRWRGEFWGKIVRSAIRILQVNPDPALEAMIRGSVRELCNCMEPDGCISTYPPEKRLSAWDVWGRKYVLLGLCRYFRYIESDPLVLETIRRTTAHLISCFPAGKRPGDGLWHDGMPANSILGAVAIAARLTGERSFSDFARRLADSGCADSMHLFRESRAGKKPADLGNGKAYEMTSCFEGLLELCRDTGEKEALDTVLTYFRDVVRNELFITGAGGLKDFWGEFWDNGAQKQMQVPPETALGETCVTTTVFRLANHLLRMTGESAIADVMESMLCNGILGAMKLDGSSWMHRNPTPLAGVSFKRPAGDQIPGYGEDCCLAQGPEALGTAACSAVMRRNDGGIALLFYEPLSLRTEIGGCAFSMTVSGSYPDDGRITIHLCPEHPIEFTLALRIPSWCSDATLETGDGSYSPAPGRFAELRRIWKPGDRIHLTLPMPLRRISAPDGSSRFALKRGPVLLVQDSRIGDVDSPCILPGGEPERRSHPEIAALYQWKNGIRLCDYASAGNRFEETNTLCVWLRGKDVPPVRIPEADC